MPATTTAPDLRSIRLIHISLVAGVLLFLAVAVFLRAGPAAVADPRVPLILAVAAVPVLLAALAMRSRLPGRRAAEPVGEWWRGNFTGAVIVWSLIEGAAMLGLVGFWLTGRAFPLAATAAAIVLFFITAPGRLASE